MEYYYYNNYYNRGYWYNRQYIYNPYDPSAESTGGTPIGIQNINPTFQITSPWSGGNYSGTSGFSGNPVASNPATHNPASGGPGGAKTKN